MDGVESTSSDLVFHLPEFSDVAGKAITDAEYTIITNEIERLYTPVFSMLGAVKRRDKNELRFVSSTVQSTTFYFKPIREVVDRYRHGSIHGVEIDIYKTYNRSMFKRIFRKTIEKNIDEFADKTNSMIFEFKSIIDQRNAEEAARRVFEVDASNLLSESGWENIQRGYSGASGHMTKADTREAISIKRYDDRYIVETSVLYPEQAIKIAKYVRDVKMGRG